MILAADAFIRQLSDARTAPIFTLFGDHKVTADWSAPKRSLPFHLLYFVTEQGFAGRIGDRLIRVESGSLLWIMPNVPHELWIEKNRPPFSVRYFRVAIDRRNQPLRLAEDVVLVPKSGESGPIMQQIVEELPSRLTFGADRLRAMLVLLFTSALRPIGTPSESDRTLSRSQRLALSQRVRQSPAKRLCPADLAKELDLSPDYFARLFRSSFGCSPRAWLVEQRVRQAAAALVSGHATISQIADRFGYQDVFLFSRQFKQVMGTGPRVYRKAH